MPKVLLLFLLLICAQTKGQDMIGIAGGVTMNGSQFVNDSLIVSPKALSQLFKFPPYQNYGYTFEGFVRWQMLPYFSLSMHPGYIRRGWASPLTTVSPIKQIEAHIDVVYLSTMFGLHTSKGKFRPEINIGWYNSLVINQQKQELPSLSVSRIIKKSIWPKGGINTELGIGYWSEKWVCKISISQRQDIHKKTTEANYGQSFYPADRRWDVPTPPLVMENYAFKLSIAKRLQKKENE